jgi:hypothetical protein
MLVAAWSTWTAWPFRHEDDLLLSIASPEAMAKVLVSNLLHDELPQRGLVESAVRDVARPLDGGTRVVTLTVNQAGDVAVRVRQPDGTLSFTTLGLHDTRDRMVEQLGPILR